ncbi:MAG: transposase, partial [Cetobacterium sp.]
MKKLSTTDPECGVFNKGEHKKVFAYSTNVACDKNNFILDFVVEPGNTHDSVAFPKLYNRLKRDNYNFKYVVVDAGYKIPAIAKLIIDDNKIPVMPYKRPMTKKGFFKKYDYVHDIYYDCCICPKNEVLNYSTTSREGYKQYKSDAKVCKKYNLIEYCTHSKNTTKIVTRHVWEDYIDLVEDIRHTRGMKELYSLRSQTIERVFADAKEKHGMRYTNYRGLAKVTMELTLKFACMNLKKLATWKWKNENSSHFSLFFEE